MLSFLTVFLSTVKFSEFLTETKRICQKDGIAPFLRHSASPASASGSKSWGCYLFPGNLLVGELLGELEDAELPGDTDIALNVGDAHAHGRGQEPGEPLLSVLAEKY